MSRPHEASKSFLLYPAVVGILILATAAVLWARSSRETSRKEPFIKAFDYDLYYALKEGEVLSLQDLADDFEGCRFDWMPIAPPGTNFFEWTQTAWTTHLDKDEYAKWAQTPGGVDLPTTVDSRFINDYTYFWVPNTVYMTQGELGLIPEADLSGPTMVRKDMLKSHYTTEQFHVDDRTTGGRQGQSVGSVKDILSKSSGIYLGTLRSRKEGST